MCASAWHKLGSLVEPPTDVFFQYSLLPAADIKTRDQFLALIKKMGYSTVGKWYAVLPRCETA